jgi:predicted dehydrogenase
VDALNAGYDVLCEKPLALTIQDIDDMINTAFLNNRILAAGTQQRYHPLYQRFKQIFTERIYGELQLIWLPMIHSGWATGKDWLKYDKTAGSGLFSMSIHDFDLSCWFVESHVARVAGFGGNAVILDQDTIDHTVLAYEYENGVKLSHGYAQFGGGYTDQVFVCTNARLFCKRSGSKILVQRNERGAQEEVIDVSADMQGDRRNATLSLHKDFVHAVRMREQPLVNGWNVRAAHIMAVAGDLAIRSGTVVNANEL